MQDFQITTDLLLKGYASGIFPMAESRDDPEVFWVDPRLRGVLPLDGFHMSRSLARAMRRTDWALRIDSDFCGVLDGCADRADTWINPEIRRLYIELHMSDDAHSFEIWEGATLVGGVYGVTLGGAFFGESMFSRRTNASKMALAAAVDHLNRSGFSLFDTQFLTPHLASLGGIEITRGQYHKRLDRALAGRNQFSDVPVATLQDVVQRITQTS
ncbi:leucyl/phenylalanyl-tRNA--protein transferase [uncultured Tateyamaria sp.]|uniref:leucyl/phenylalanyl-tRNA--protein transferase n=1 Tax=uncultured Tateyamaria sp. TaxID=455651 RepID=UPI00262B5C14|nr:leucyl/phenylalanyl-tRNA--protein transferase [uncultured Tateyamaria sp.]